ALPCPVGQIVRAHEARIIDEAVPNQEIDGIRTKVPGRRAVTARLAASQAQNGLVRALHVGLLPPPLLISRRHVGPAVMGDLMARLYHRLAFARIGLDSEAGREPSRPNTA